MSRPSNRGRAGRTSWAAASNSVWPSGDTARASAGYRDYPVQAVNRLGFVRDAQAAGLTLAEIRSVLAIRDSGQAPLPAVVLDDGGRCWTGVPAPARTVSGMGVLQLVSC
ncbi:MAG: MerR family DNA-binding protein [Actinomycetota bacterium]|nr:MerR family DNA-binding protein [Actinomycetota bacterium]